MLGFRARDRRYTDVGVARKPGPAEVTGIYLTLECVYRARQHGLKLFRGTILASPDFIGRSHNVSMKFLTLLGVSRIGCGLPLLGFHIQLQVPAS